MRYLLALILIFGCSVAAGSSKEAVYPSGTEFDRTDDGKEVYIIPKTEILIKLDEHVFGSYQWGILQNNKSIFEVVSEETKVEKKDGKSVKYRIFKMRATKVGKSNLKMVYFPSGSKDVAGATYSESFRLWIKIIDQ